MQIVNLPNLPARRATDFQLDGFSPPRYARVIYQPQENKPDRAVIEAQAFEVDRNGNFCQAPSGAPSRTAGTTHSINLTGVGDTHTLVPGWVRVIGTFNDENLPEGTQVVTSLPDSGQEGEQVWLGDRLYRWSAGMIMEIMRGKAEELAGLLRNSQAMAVFEL